MSAEHGFLFGSAFIEKTQVLDAKMPHCITGNVFSSSLNHNFNPTQHFAMILRTGSPTFLLQGLVLVLVVEGDDRSRLVRHYDDEI